MDLSFKDPSLFGKGFTVKILRSGKVVLKQEGKRTHITLHPGNRTGIIDLHETDETVLDGDPAKHKRIGKLSKAELGEKLSAIGPQMIADLVAIMRPIRLGWIMRRHLIIGPAFPSDAVFQEISGVRVRSGQAEISELFKTAIQPPAFYDEVLQQPATAYYLYDGKKYPATLYGALLPHRGLDGRVQMKWFKLRDLMRWAAKWETICMEIFSPLLGGATEGDFSHRGN